MKKHTRTLLLFLFLGIIGISAYSQNLQIIAEQVLTQLYETNANKQFSKPTLTISSNHRKVATFYPRQNRIELEEQAWAVCQSFGEDALDALAFILGHELAHAYLHDPLHPHPSNYLACESSSKTGQLQEKQADVFGVFNAYLADYKTVQVLPQLITRLYEHYGFSDDTMPSYPPLTERQQAAKEALAMVRQLIDVYEAATYLTVMGKYQMAADCFQYISDSYTGREIYNNLAVNYALQAIHFTDKDVDVFVYPLELDWTTRLRKKDPDRAQVPLTAAEKRLRSQYLQQAQQALHKALELDPAYPIGHINQVCLYGLQEQNAKAVAHYEKIKKQWVFPPSAAPDFDLAAGVAYAKMNTPNSLPKARIIFNQYQKKASPALVWQAAYNLKMMNSQKCDPLKNYVCVLPPNFPRLVDGIRLHRVNLTNDAGILLNENKGLQLFVAQHAHSTVYQLITSGQEEMTFQVVRQFSEKGQQQKLSEEQLLRIIGVNRGYFEVCRKNGLVFRRDENGELVEWGKFIK